jgi:PEP-CTERM motif
MKTLFVWAVLLVFTLPALADPIVDGSRDLEYGAPVSVQLTQTQFGDASPPGALGGSELDAAYARIFGGRLYLLLTGNLEPNFNKLEIFIDSRAGGENTLSNAPGYDFFTGSIWLSQNLGGLKFDAGFEPDYHLFTRWGSGTGAYNADFIDRQGGVNNMVPGSTGATPNAVGLVASGSIAAGNVGPNASASALTQNLDFAINDNNSAGVTGGTGAANPADAAAVLTGMEFSIALADLGNPAPGSTILIAAMINNGDHNYLSNQVLGALPPPQGNLGGDGNGNFTGTLVSVNFNQFAGPQYFAVGVPVPEPSAIASLAIALAALAGRFRRTRGK